MSKLQFQGIVLVGIMVLISTPCAVNACYKLSDNATSHHPGPCAGCIDRFSLGDCRCTLTQHKCNGQGELILCDFVHDRAWSSGGGCEVWICQDYCYRHYDCQKPDGTTSPCFEYLECDTATEEFGGWANHYITLCE
jgi:hypothetical protein